MKYVVWNVSQKEGCCLYQVELTLITLKLIERETDTQIERQTDRHAEEERLLL